MLPIYPVELESPGIHYVSMYAVFRKKTPTHVFFYITVENV